MRDRRRETRSAEDLDLSDYLVSPYGLASGSQWRPHRTIEQAVGSSGQLHYAERTGDGAYVRLEGGRPALRDSFVDYLDGYSAAEVDLALKVAVTAHPEDRAILDWYRLPRHGRASRYRLAIAIGLDESSISRRWRSLVSRTRLYLDLIRRYRGGQLAAAACPAALRDALDESPQNAPGAVT